MLGGRTRATLHYDLDNEQITVAKCDADFVHSDDCIRDRLLIGNINGAAVSCALPVSWSWFAGKGDAAVGDAEHSDDVRPISALMSRRRRRALWLSTATALKLIFCASGSVGPGVVDVVGSVTSRWCGRCPVGGW